MNISIKIRNSSSRHNIAIQSINDIKDINDVNYIYFSNCNFENLSDFFEDKYPKNVKQIKLDNCQINHLDFRFENLTELYVENCQIGDYGQLPESTEEI